MADKGQGYAPYPEGDNWTYRGIPVPGRLKATWNNVSGRWWRQGIDDVLDSIDDFEQETFGR